MGRILFLFVIGMIEYRKSSRDRMRPWIECGLNANVFGNVSCFYISEINNYSKRWGFISIAVKPHPVSWIDCGLNQESLPTEKAKSYISKSSFERMRSTTVDGPWIESRREDGARRLYCRRLPTSGESDSESVCESSAKVGRR